MELGRLAESLEARNEPSRKCGLLIVDDEGGVRGVLNVGMRRQGFTVWLAADDRALCLTRQWIFRVDPLRVAMLRPDSREFLVWTVRVLWTVRLRDGLYENGAAILETGQADPSFCNQRPPDPSQWAYSGFASPSPYLTFIQALFRSPKLNAG